MSTDRESTFEAWRAALASDEGIDRSDAAEAPPEDADPADIVAALIPLLTDPNDLVRMSAAEALGWYPGTAAADALRAHLAVETDDLVRAYTLSSLALVGTIADLDVLLRALGPEATPHMAIYALVGLHELVRRLVKQGLAAYLPHERPEVRYTAADALAQVVSEHDDDDALAALREQLARETMANIRSDLRTLIAEVWGEAAVDEPEQD
jgi:HEAT repeat protein